MNRKDPVDLPETALLREDHLRRFTQPVLPIEVNTAVDQRLCVRERPPRRQMVEEVVEPAVQMVAERFFPETAGKAQPPLGIAVPGEPVEVGVLPGESTPVKNQQRGEYAGAAMGLPPRVAAPVERLQKRQDSFRSLVLCQRPDRMERRRIQNFQGGNAVRRRMVRVVIAFLEEAVFRILKRLQRPDGLLQFLRFRPGQPQRITNVDGVCAAVLIVPQFAVLFGGVPQKTAVFPRPGKLMGLQYPDDFLDDRIQIYTVHLFSMRGQPLFIAAEFPGSRRIPGKSSEQGPPSHGRR